MKILVAGATGVIGRRLVPLLVHSGHDVAGLTRLRERAPGLEALGARAVVGDALDRDGLIALVRAERPEVVIDELSDTPRELGPGHTEEQFAGTNRLRMDGTRNLVDAARAAGARRVIAQSYAHIYAPQGGWVKHENDPLNLGSGVPEGRRHSVEAIVALEDAVLHTPGIEGLALRYGAFYGPGTTYAADGAFAQLVRIRHMPVVGGGRGVTSFIHVDDAAAVTALALRGPTGVYNVVDDYPAAAADWLPFYAELLGARPPAHVPALLVRTLGREHFAFRSTEQRGASNLRARRDLGLVPVYASWRKGFAAELREERMAA